jgi:ADP-heptose:LPS heptosyltransferase
MRFLVHRTHALGDVLNTTPVVRRLRREHPAADIDISTYYPAVFANNPDITRIGAGGRYDKVIPLSLVYERNRRIHQVDAHFLAAFGDVDGDKTIVFRADEAPDLGVDCSQAVAFHPNVSWPSRTLRSAWWNALAARMVAEGYSVISLGTMIDHALSGPGVVDTRGRLTLAQQAGVISACRALVCGDSAMFTLVGATETPAVGLCTITRPEYFMPFRRGELGWNFTPIVTQVPCFGCRELDPASEYHFCSRGDNACVDSFRVKDVALATLRAIQNDRR